MLALKLSAPKGLGKELYLRAYKCDGIAMTYSYDRRVAARPLPLDKSVVHQQAKEVAKEITRQLKRRYPQEEPLGVVGGLNASQYVAKMYLDVLGPIVNVRGQEVGDMALFITSDVSTSADWFVDAGLGTMSSGAPVIVIELNGKYTPEVLAKVMPKLDGHIYKFLIHELTHAMDVIRKTKKNIVTGPRDAFDWDSYYNDPAEVKAYMQEIVDEVLEKAPKLKRLAPDQQFYVRTLLNTSPSYNKIKDYLDRRNNQTILKAVYTALEEGGWLEP